MRILLIHTNGISLFQQIILKENQVNTGFSAFRISVCHAD